MKPGARPGQTQGKKWLGPLRGTIDRFLSGGSQKDPLYLTNRTLGQKMKAWSVVAVPCLLIIGFVALTLSRDYFDPPEGKPQKEMSPEEVSRKILPNIGKDILIETNHDVEVVEVHVDGENLKLTGSLRNNSTKLISVLQSGGPDGACFTALRKLMSGCNVW